MWFQSLSLSSEMPLCEWEKTHTCPYNPLHQVLKPLLKIQAIAWIILCMVFGTGHKKRKGSETSEHHRSPEIQEINATSPHIYICLLFCCRNVILLKKCCFYADNVVCCSAVVLFWWKLCWFFCKLCCFRANCTIYRNLRCFVTKYACYWRWLQTMKTTWFGILFTFSCTRSQWTGCRCTWWSAGRTIPGIFFF